MHRIATVLALVLLAGPLSYAHHRQTPAITAITTTGDGTLPRLAPPSRKAIAVGIDATIAVVYPFKNGNVPPFIFTTGTNANPTISSNGKTVAWDTDADPAAGGAPGLQVVMAKKLVVSQAAIDPTGTSENPALDLAGLYTAFESTGDLAGIGNAGARQIFLRGPDGALTQISRGAGTSRNPSVGRRGRRVVFDSTSDPVTEADTGIAQIWIAELTTGTATPITSGLGASTTPSLSNDGRVVVFESSADLAGDGHDTGTTQIFAYDTISQTFARITDEPGGCTGPTSARIKRDWRIAYVCGGTAYFTMLRADERYEVQADGGDTTRLVPQADAHFMLIATTADLLAGSGTTAGHRVYMVNLFARSPNPLPSSVVWFPFQGLAPL